MHNQLYMVMFCPKKLISPDVGPQIPPTLAQITLTYSISMSELLADHIAGVFFWNFDYLTKPRIEYEVST